MLNDNNYHIQLKRECNSPARNFFRFISPVGIIGNNNLFTCQKGVTYQYRHYRKGAI
ncbi:hypothetical protein BN1182_AZ_00850 [Pantoea ananatis]|nr:hypothetical protein BN1182_AZ_00850 [Pantoea ananatis]